MGSKIRKNKVNGEYKSPGKAVFHTRILEERGAHGERMVHVCSCGWESLKTNTFLVPFILDELSGRCLNCKREIVLR